MSNLLINPHYCPEDKDVLDFANLSAVSLEDLESYLRNRGVYASSLAKKEDLAALIARETFSWTDVKDLLALLTSPLKKQQYLMAQHDTSANFDLVAEATHKVNTFRSNKYGDRIQITSLGENEYRIAIDYKKIYYEKTRLIQCVEQDAEIYVTRTPSGFRTRRSAGDEAQAVELAIIGELEKLSPEHKIVTKKILLSSLNSIESKVNFFIGLMEGIDGYEFKDIKSVRVQSSKTDNILDSEEGDDFAKEYASKIESLVISGRNVGSSELYDSYVGKDFFITSSNWHIISDTNEYRVAEVQATFVPILKDHELQFSVVGVQVFRENELQPRAKPNPLASARFAELLRASAERSHLQVLESQKSA